MDDANQEIEKSVDVPASIWPDVIRLIREHEEEHQLTPSGAVHDALRRYFGLHLEEGPISAPAFKTTYQQNSSPENLNEPLPEPQDALGAFLTPSFHPETEAALRLLKMALANHPKDRAAASAELLNDLVMARRHF